MTKCKSLSTSNCLKINKGRCSIKQKQEIIIITSTVNTMASQRSKWLYHQARTTSRSTTLICEGWVPGKTIALINLSCRSFTSRGHLAVIVTMTVSMASPELIYHHLGPLSLALEVSRLFRPSTKIKRNRWINFRHILFQIIHRLERPRNQTKWGSSPNQSKEP